MKEIQLFENSEFGQVMAIEKEGNPWLVAKEVAEILEYRMASDMTRRLDDDEKGTHSVQTLGGEQQVTIINESGFYNAVLGSQKPEAKQFKKWVTSEVLPAIRKHGIYATPMTVEQMIEDPDHAIRLLQELKFEQEQKRLAEKQRDEAVATKALIGSKREATSMATASTAARKAHALEDRIGEGEHWKQVKAIPWIKDVFTVSRGMWMAVGKRLKNISIDMGFDVKQVPDSEFGVINRYHVDVIEEFRIRLSRDLNMLWKYRV